MRCGKEKEGMKESERGRGRVGRWWKRESISYRIAAKKGGEEMRRRESADGWKERVRELASDGIEGAAKLARKVWGTQRK